jgi:pimeloyl-ACP methyl ester carboxylesterase
MPLARFRSVTWLKSLPLPGKTWSELRVELPIKALQRLTLPVWKRAGYRLEVRRVGELKIGVLRLKVHGKKRANPKRLIFVPGLGDSPISWLPIFLMLRPVFRQVYDEVLLLDYPGFMDTMRELTFDIFDSLRPHTIVGHSLGAWLAAAYAIECGHGRRPAKASMHYRHPARIVLASPSGVLADETKKEEWLARFREARDQGSAGGFRRYVFASEPAWFGTLADSFMSFLDKKEVVDFMNSVADKHMVTDELSKIGAETWLVWGEKDALVPSQWVHDWLERLNPVVMGGATPEHEEPLTPRRGPSHAVVIRGAGHSPHLERPVTTAAALGKILLGRKFKPTSRLWSRLTWAFHDGASAKS